MEENDELNAIEKLHKQTFRLWEMVGRALLFDFDKMQLKLPWTDDEKKLLEEADELLRKLTAMLYNKKEAQK